TALPCDLPRKGCQFSVGGSSPCAFGCAEFCGGRIVRHLHLYHEQFCVIAVGESTGPANSLVGGFRAVGANHHAPYGVTLQMLVHKRSKPCRKNDISIYRFPYFRLCWWFSITTKTV